MTISAGPATGRQGAIERYAKYIQTGQSTRDTSFGWFSSVGDREDITEAVLALAGPETPDEIEGRAVHAEKQFPWRLEGHIGSWLDEELCGAFRHHYLDHDFEIGDSDDDAEIYLIRDDGKRYTVEIDVHVAEVPA